MELEQQIIDYALQHEPHEMCGFVVFDGNKNRFIPCENQAEDKANYFEISDLDYIKAEAQGELVAVVHSHPEPNGKPVLSTLDRKMQVQTGLDWWLVHNQKIHKFRNVPHLIGREFKHGTMDCYTLYRDAYMLAGYEMDEFERQDDWWHTGQNLYLDNIQGQGFERVETPQIGDVILMQVGADVPNHAAIYIGDQMVVHHSPNRLSKRDLYDGYWLRHTHSIWRHKLAEKLDFDGILNDIAVNN
ncbi:TPA: C40 family peptidase [Mannheimia haemolytica]|uniref:C40 family peptidase n=1 Tax=Mannheimia haemolytica TaxID=75985 RepID=UPI0001594862|nr:NlpC/P60 family protein [Mannheimia haemolytica]AWW72691.1 phage tail protein [Pasteurellaceae bacterium 12565]AGK02109.1 putative tail fiber endopeptidase K [Mannheimia haemolytica M42548]AGK02261.1 putative endopeptidase K [Mannheimia haemolytica M42548]AGQ39850.1 phage tail protein [Mannheimia haemolytica D174]AGR73700.1 phage tail protein [Mannheimia haemolytica USMARC_2286]